MWLGDIHVGVTDLLRGDPQTEKCWAPECPHRLVSEGGLSLCPWALPGEAAGNKRANGVHTVPWGCWRGHWGTRSCLYVFFLIRILALSAQALRGLYSTEFLRSLFHIVELYAVSSQKYVNLLFFYFQISNYIDKSSMYKVLSVGQAVKNTWHLQSFICSLWLNLLQQPLKPCNKRARPRSVTSVMTCTLLVLSEASSSLWNPDVWRRMWAAYLLLRPQTLQVGSEDGGKNPTCARTSKHSETRKGFGRLSG